MKSIDLRQMQHIELDILLELDKLCKKHGLRYYMDGGTLLGAMCYEGFIPWDDDIDIKMPRPDYEKLLMLGDELPNHICIDAPTRGHCEYTMTKLIDSRTVLIERSGEACKRTGVYIDVFPMDGHPDGEKARQRHINKLRRLNALFHNSLERFSSLKRSKSLKTIFKGYIYDIMYTPYGLYRRMTAAAKRFDYEKCGSVGLLVEGDSERERFPKEWLEPAVMLEFEGHMLPAPCGYREHLRVFYGAHITNEEYHHNLPMILPDHDHEVFWAEVENDGL